MQDLHFLVETRLTELTEGTEVTPEQFSENLAVEYTNLLAKQGYIIIDKNDLSKEFGDEVLTFVRKKTYGFVNLVEYAEHSRKNKKRPKMGASK